MSIRVSPCATVSTEARQKLERELLAYYSSSPAPYYLRADSAAANYTETSQPFHCDLVKRVERGQRVVEVGCGSAHLCRFVEAAGGNYTGLDHGEELLQQNRRRFPGARFLNLGVPLQETFDIVASLYTIEHVVDPPAYLERLWELCRPGGLIAVICPDFIDGAGFPPSFYYGKTPRRLREKLTPLSIADTVGHLFDLFWRAPRWKKRARTATPGVFWINLAPRIFAGAPYTTDADAVHLPRLKDLLFWLRSRGTRIIQSSLGFPDVSLQVLKHNCYVLAEKPAK